MTVNQVHALAVVVLFLASVIVALFGPEIAGGLGGAWARGSAQAAHEKRRLAKAVRPHESDETFAAEQAAARRARARKESTAARRVRGAIADGWFIGSRGAARFAAGERRRNTRRSWTAGDDGTVRPPGSSGSGTGTSTGGGGRRPGGSSGPRTRTQQRSRFRSRRALGVCDNCGVTVARASLKGKACFLCRRKREPQGSDQRRPVSSADTAAPKTPLSPAGSVPETLPAGSASRPAVAVPVPESLPAPGSIPVPGTAPRVPAMAGAPATAIASPTGRAVMPARPAAIGYTRPGAVAVRGGTAPAIGGDGTTHGGWTRNAWAIINALAAVKVFQDRMLADLNGPKVNGSESQIRDIRVWSDHVTAHRAVVLDGLLATDARLKPYIDAVMAAGGHREVADAAYHADY
jgi:hypothetical protein